MNDISSILPEYYKHKIAVVGKRNFFVDYRDSLVSSIRQYGFDATAYTEIDEALVDNPTCVVVINPLLYPRPNNKSIIWIMIQTEQLFHNDDNTQQIFFEGNVKRIKPYLSFYDLILEWDRINIMGLQKLTKTKVVYCPHYWYPSLDYNVCSDGIEDKKYDLLFIGNMPGVDNRRQKLLDFLIERYKTFPIRNDLWGINKAKALASAKICLNIHFDESRYMESARLNDYFSNKCFVLSEPIRNPEPFIEGKDYIEFFWTNICNLIDYYLEHERERNAIAESAYRRIHEHTLLDSARVLIDNLILESYNRYRKKTNSISNSIGNKVKQTIKKILK